MTYPHAAELEDFVSRGYCSKRRHARHAIWIYNYTAKAQYDFAADTWPEPLRDARGLVLDSSGEIIARGFRKFFNLSQLTRMPEGQPQFWEKVDGSLILIFRYDGERVCSTRGSFESEQALWAEAFLRRSARPDWAPSLETETLLCEAVYPANRIVVDYRGAEELVYLATSSCDGSVVVEQASAVAPFRAARFFGYHEARFLPGNEGEGFVLYWPDGTLAKVKLDEYTAIHRMLFLSSTRSVWEMLRAGKDPSVEAVRLPERPRAWIAAYAAELRRAHGELIASVRAEYEAFVEGRDGLDRKSFAGWATGRKYPALLFRFFDSKTADIEDYAWKMVEPEFERPDWAREPEE